MDPSTPEAQFALAAVSEAARLSRRIQSELGEGTLQKEDRSPVTVADFSVQALIARRLWEAFPDDVLVAEEDSAPLHRPESQAVLDNVVRWVNQLAPGVGPQEVCEWVDRGGQSPQDRFWTLDPIDGTKGFLRGKHYAVALALVEDGEVQIGVMGCPHWSAPQAWQENGPGGLVMAVRGQGAWWRPLEGDEPFERLRVSECRRADQARILRSYEAAHTSSDKISRLAQLLGSQADPIRMDSQAKYAVLASGRGDLLLRFLRPDQPNYRERIWDQAAGSLVTREAGGRITDLDGRELDFQAGRTLARNRGILASNGRLHTACLEALRLIG